MIDYQDRLNRLRQRRSIPTLEKSITLDSIGQYPLNEAFERVSSNPVIKYTAGAMEAMPKRSTEICWEEAMRVESQLQKRIIGIDVRFRLQGSVPLDVHIEHSSDVDLLTLMKDRNTLQFLSHVRFQNDPNISSLMDLRSLCERQLALAFPAVEIDATGDKAISMTGGSLQRKIDVVPAVWHGYDHQEEWERDISILHKQHQRLLNNRPFLHMKKINEKDQVTYGGAKRAIRLLKSLKRDSPRESLITLSSYDIASLVWHMDNQRLMLLREPKNIGLLIMAMRDLIASPLTMFLKTPDDSRAIFEDQGKMTALKILFSELNVLNEDIREGQARK